MGHLWDVPIYRPTQLEFFEAKYPEGAAKACRSSEEFTGSDATVKTEDVTILDSQNILMINEDEEVGVNAVTDPKVVSNERLPKELRICVWWMAIS